MGEYSVWFNAKDGHQRLFLSDIPSYPMAERIVNQLNELFGVNAWIEQS